jgi:hypothetical protein
MKIWLRKDEWVELALCEGSGVHTMENPTELDKSDAKLICDECLVRPECIEWAVREKACSVFVAGVYLPDPMNKRDLKLVYSQLSKSLPAERELRGDDI